MTTEDEANRARSLFSESLRKQGAHAIAVDQVGRGSKKTFAVIAFVQDEKTPIPETLKIKSGHSTIHVPVVKRVSETFKPE